MAEIIYNLPGFVTLPSVIYDGNATLTQISANRIVFTDSTTPVAFVATINNDDLNILLSAVLDGAQMQSPTQVQRIYENIVGWFEMPVDFCALIAECIANSDVTQQALQDELAKNGTGTTDTSRAVGSGVGNILQGLDCDYDTIYGVAVALEDYIYGAARDAWELVLDTAVDAVARLRLIDYAPMLGDLPAVDDLNDLITQIRTFGIAAFDIGYSAQIRQDNICGLFALACENCVMTASDVARYYAEGAGLNWQVDTQIIALLSAISGGTFTEILVVRAWQALVANVLAVGGGVLQNVGIFSFQQVAASGDPDGDWAIFCDPCVPAVWSYSFDLTTQPPATNVDIGQFTAQGFGNVDYSNGPEALRGGVLDFVFPKSVNITDVSARFKIDAERPFALSECAIVDTTNGNRIDPNGVQNNELRVLYQNTSVNTQGFRVRIAGGVGGDALCTEFNISGTGFDPFA